MALCWESKRPGEVRTYQIDWSTFLGDDTIASRTLVATGVTVDNGSGQGVIDAGAKGITVKLSGGTSGTLARIVNTIVTTAGETEVEEIVLRISDYEEPISVADAKTYLRVRHDEEDPKIAGMIPRAREWVEDFTGLALTQRKFVEHHWPKYGAIRLFKGPLVAATAADVEIGYTADGQAGVYVGRLFPPSSVIFPAADSTWPTLESDDRFEITYTAGFAAGDVDPRLIGAMFALIEGEYAEGHAYPASATEAAERCCSFLRNPVL